MISLILNWFPRFLFPEAFEPEPINSSIEDISDRLATIDHKSFVPDYAVEILRTKAFIKPQEYRLLYGWVRIGLNTDDETIISRALSEIRESPSISTSGIEISPMQPAQRAY
ncbi:hypothetical protein H072_8508 [Dactylellina haptotyla CBS 200.50]|uniref:Uncharacterized protein n=1 Tax=Dactylellina haptotyla (strain CBS 200.50) TaxID=1284197 RepID=S8AA32_DACHA|nr:hypothetical protein H072_8508 [Dactylellina haptotyla CBS 200.50]